MTHSIGGGLTVRSIVGLARAAGLALPADVEQLVEIAETVRTTKDSRAEQSPGNCLREVALTPASAAGALRDLALARARAAEMDQAGYEWLNEIDRRTKIALSQHAEQLITELAAVFEDNYAPVYRDAARLITPEDSETTVVRKGGAALSAFNDVKRADQQFASMIAPLRRELGGLAGEAGMPRAAMFTRDGENVDRDELDVIADTDGSLPLIICSRGHDLHVNTAKQASALLVAAKQRQQVKERGSELVMVVGPRSDGFRGVLPHQERVRRGAETGNDGGTIVARSG